MPIEYRNIISINCSKDEGNWKCILNRRLSDKPIEVDNQLCYSTKQETIVVSDVELKENANVCNLHDTGQDKFLRCE